MFSSSTSLTKQWFLLFRVWGKQEQTLANWSAVREPMDTMLIGEWSETTVMYVNYHISLCVWDTQLVGHNTCIVIVILLLLSPQDCKSRSIFKLQM